ncbi:MAG: DUF1957 domain-containing protein [Spirochaetaceae bacterium]|nr:DUF1957 domain-containing protein [Spirochaetaceae bacterium]
MTLNNKTGVFNLVLYGHLPYLRPGYDTAKESWLFEALTSSYLPLIRALKRLAWDNVPFSLSLVLSPTLISLLNNHELQEKYHQYLKESLLLTEGNPAPAGGDSWGQSRANFHYNHLNEALKQFKLCNGNIFNEFIALRNSGHLEFVASAATTAFMPLFQFHEYALRPQLDIAVKQHEQLLGEKPQGFWLPHCGYYNGLEKLLEEYDIKYFYTASHALLYANEAPLSGTYRPVMVKGSNVAAFSRDRASTNEIWKNESKLAYLKYNNENEQLLDDTEKVLALVKEQATIFSQRRLNQFKAAKALMGSKSPLITTVLDLEFLGQWGAAGSYFLEEVVLALAKADDIICATAKNYLQQFHNLQQLEITSSSWGEEDSYNQFWLDKKNAWLLPHLYKMIERMHDIAARFSDATSIKKHMLNQAAREVLLAMNSDLPLMLKAQVNEELAMEELSRHFDNFYQIYKSICSNKINIDWLANDNKEYNFFDEFIDYRRFI